MALPAMNNLRISAALAALLVHAPPCLAQTAPDFFGGKTVRLVVGYPAGAGFDT
jgi:tripartite-type tricarboxylate transporter receptor subunit TctC